MVELLLLGRHDRRAIRSVPRRLSLSLTGTDGDITDAALRSGRVRRDGRTGRRARRSGASESGDHVERLAQERRNVTTAAALLLRRRRRRRGARRLLRRKRRRRRSRLRGGTMVRGLTTSPTPGLSGATRCRPSRRLSRDRDPIKSERRTDFARSGRVEHRERPLRGGELFRLALEGRFALGSFFRGRLLQLEELLGQRRGPNGQRSGRGSLRRERGSEFWVGAKRRGGSANVA